MRRVALYGENRLTPVGDGTVIPGRDPFGAQALYLVLVRWARWKVWLNRYGDVLLAVALGLALLTEMLLWDGGDKTPGVVLVVLASAGLAVRRTQPIPAFIVCWLGLMGAVYFMPGVRQQLLNVRDRASSSPCSRSGAHTRGREIWAGGVFLVVIGIAVFVVTDSDTASVAGDVVFGIVFVGGPWAAGLALRLRGDLARTNALLIVEQEEATRRAVAEERRHRPGAARRGLARHRGDRAAVPRGAPELGRDEEQVRRALDAIEHTNTQALGDMRRLLALLRDTEGDAGDRAPQPSLARLDDLVDDVRESGLAVELSRSARTATSRPGVDLSAYRIVQEALTNVLKHAGAGARRRVRLDYGADELTLSVTRRRRRPTRRRTAPGTV